MTYFLLLPCWLAMEILGKTLWPILPIFAVNRYGPVDNNNGTAVEPRLPTWLAWFDTPDNSLWGDTGWRTIHCPDNWNTYKGMALWLLRNSSVGFSRTVLARTVHQEDIKWSGNPHIQADQNITGVFKANDGKGTWQYKRVFPLFGKYIGLNFGWNIDPMVKSGIAVDSCHHKVAVKIKDAIALQA